jgi:peptide-methionine (R)-S-oxide reductase
MKRREFLVGLLACTVLFACDRVSTQPESTKAESTPADRVGDEEMTDKVVKTEEEWKEILTPEEYHVLWEKGTERAFANEYYDNKEEGVYHCAGCGNLLFSSEHKFKSGTGWPSFYKPISKDAVREEADNSLFMKRTEILCNRCGGHLGHVFSDGPEPTGQRYCMNSVALDFEPAEG